MATASLTIGVLATAPADARTPAGTSGSVQGSAAGCAGPAHTEQGTCTHTIATRTMSRAAARQATAKRRFARQLTRTAARGGRLLRVSATAPAAYQMPAVANMTIYREGQGNGKKSYTCGPSATRNMVSAMNRAYTGQYKDYGEHAFEIWEHTTTSGTSAANVAATLNNHFYGFGHWKTYRPSSAGYYMAQIRNDTYNYHQPVIKNLDTEYLGYYHGKALNHFNFDYGYSISPTSTDYTWIADEWDPIYTYGSSSYGEPYGKHKVAATAAYNAVIHTAYHYMII